MFFVEHRFYGESLPFGESSFDESYLPYLSVDQVTADYMYLIYFYKYALGISDAQIITFGSFYAGSLASYMRFKYPDHITGALASGAPLRMADEFETRSTYWETVTSIFKGGSEVSRFLGSSDVFLKSYFFLPKQFLRALQKRARYFRLLIKKFYFY